MDLYSDIVVLDDGSDDGTWEALNEYSDKYKNIHVFKNDKNSVKEYSENRWKTLNRIAAEYDPTWIHLRAADMLYSHPAKKLIRKQLERFLKGGILVASIPIAHLWRSEYWYRADNFWGQSIREHITRTFYRFNPNATWRAARNKAGMHQGAAVPDNLGFDGPKRSAYINDGIPRKEGVWQIVGLHLGHTTHEKKVRKFNWSMESASAAAKNGLSVSMPPPERMPKPENWLRFNGYKGFVEWNMNLQKAPQFWFDHKIGHEPKPVPKSLYETIKKWNPDRAEEYKILFERCYGSS